ncbi:hypothetical protein LXL04_020288 [Taraxacum kok-saghyz]
MSTLIYAPKLEHNSLTYISDSAQQPTTPVASSKNLIIATGIPSLSTLQPPSLTMSSCALLTHYFLKTFSISLVLYEELCRLSTENPPEKEVESLSLTAADGSSLNPSHPTTQ